MSKNKHGDLFNTSLTEIIIILFFVLMLFALFNIDKVNKENVDLGDEVDSLTTKLIIEKERADSNEEIANARPVSLAPIAAKQAQQIADLKQTQKELEEKIVRLQPTPNDPPPPLPSDDPTSPPQPPIGDCNDGFWRECAEKAWPIASNPSYEYLFDIGICSSGDIVAIRSEWRQKKEIDFIMVDGASAITDQMNIKASDTDKFISLIHNKSLDFKPGQTQHVARVIALEPIYDTEWSPASFKLEQHLKLDTFDRGSNKHKKILERFPENPCNVFKENKKTILDESQPTELIQEAKESEQSSQNSLEKNILVSPSKAIFKFNIENFECKRSARKRNPPFAATFNLVITKKNTARVISYEYEKTNRNNRLIILDARSAIESQRKDIKAAVGSNEVIDNKVQLKLNFIKDVCR